MLFSLRVRKYLILFSNPARVDVLHDSLLIVIDLFVELFNIYHLMRTRNLL